MTAVDLSRAPDTKASWAEEEAATLGRECAEFIALYHGSLAQQADYNQARMAAQGQEREQEILATGGGQAIPEVVKSTAEEGETEDQPDIYYLTDVGALFKDPDAVAAWKIFVQAIQQAQPGLLLDMLMRTAVYRLDVMAQLKSRDKPFRSFINFLKTNLNFLQMLKYEGEALPPQLEWLRETVN